MNKWFAPTVIVLLVLTLAVMTVLFISEAGRLKDATASRDSLKTQLASANTEIASLQAETQKVEDPQHFSSLDELKTWLQKDDTNTKYASLRPIERAYILQVRALRDGYLLPAGFAVTGGTFYSFNTAYINGTIYKISPTTDAISAFGDDGTPLEVNPIAAHPLPLQ